MLAAGANPSTVDSHGKWALQIAAETSHLTRVGSLLPASPDPAVRAALFAAATSACDAPLSSDPSGHAVLQAVLHAPNMRQPLVEDVLRQLETQRKAAQAAAQKAAADAKHDAKNEDLARRAKSQKKSEGWERGGDERARCDECNPSLGSRAPRAGQDRISHRARSEHQGAEAKLPGLRCPARIRCVWVWGGGAVRCGQYGGW